MDKGLEALNHPFIRSVLFHPRPQESLPPEGASDLLFSAYDGTRLGARLYPAKSNDPLILFFHGNGEIAADYDDIGPLYQKLGMSLCVADFRGYGASLGEPSVPAMLEDTPAILGEVRRMRKKQSFDGPLVVMGRSLGSASAIEIAHKFPEAVSGLILESAFSRTGPLLNLLSGGGLRLFEDESDDPIGNLRKIKEITLPLLVIHAEFDHIISIAQGEELFEQSASTRKGFYLVKNANHNDILFRDLAGYLSAIAGFVKNLT